MIYWPCSDNFLQIEIDFYWIKRVDENVVIGADPTDPPTCFQP